MTAMPWRTVYYELISIAIYRILGMYNFGLLHMTLLLYSCIAPQCDYVLLLPSPILVPMAVYTNEAAVLQVFYCRLDLYAYLHIN